MAANVEEYLQQFEGVCRDRLSQVRQIILKEAPDAVENISYGMPAYKTFGKPLVYFAGYAKHIGLYATPSGHAAFEAELASYKQGKGSVQFPHNQPLPEDLIRRIVAFRTQENIDRNT
ncbi:MAG: DUF1801 domain-containing protein [Schleiferiaceae bacterium]